MVDEAGQVALHAAVDAEALRVDVVMMLARGVITPAAAAAPSSRQRIRAWCNGGRE